MKTIQLDKGNRFSNNDKVKFLLLGSDTEPGPVMRRAIKAKVNKTTTEPVSTVWATLGMADDSDVLWSGELKFSETGNDRSLDATGEEVEILREMNKEAIEKSGKKIIEHFINFDDVDFNLGDTFSAGKIPQLRLTLFLQPDEGALVYYEHYETLFAKGEPSEVQYILPEKKDTKNFVHTDRLSYLFDLLPTDEIAETEKKGIFKFLKGNKKRSFIIKALVFPRDNSTQSADGIIGNLVKNFLPAKPHRLLFFNAAQNAFQDAQANPASSFINPTLKTLLLLHGTFADTEKSFGGLIDKDNKPTSWLQDLIIKRKYQQVLAYDHPTIVKNAEQNVADLLELLGDIKFAQENPVSIISTSRGGLVAKYIMGTKHIQQNILPVDKAILVACGNGSHYYKTGQHIAKFLSLLRSGFKIAGGGFFVKGILSAAQFSAEYFLNEPGSLMMTIKKDGSMHPDLLKILAMKPQLATTEIYAICDDWEKSLLAEEAKLIRRWVTSGLDKIIKQTVFDGLEHDWVIANKQQMLMPATTHVKAIIQAKSSHTKVLVEGKSKIVNGTSPKEQIKDRIWAILHN